jgi:aminoglycoside 6'-N-acetyltransferase I
LCTVKVLSAKWPRIAHPRKIEEMTAHRIREAESADKDQLAAMMVSLWPDGTFEEFRQEAEALIETQMCGTMPGTILVAAGNEGLLAGFIQVGLRSHADGCDVAHAVGFVEGWFVQEDARGRGAGRDLMRAAEKWARAQGCAEMASDALIENEDSQSAHSALGFEMVDRCVHFRKPLKTDGD